MLEALLVSTAVVALGELGDKTQLLALVLAARYRKPAPIVAGWPGTSAVRSGTSSASTCAVLTGAATATPASRAASKVAVRFRMASRSSEVYGWTTALGSRNFRFGSREKLELSLFPADGSKRGRL